MQVTQDRVLGTIGGGQLEWQALQAARQMLLDGTAKAELQLSLGPSLRQCCGGRVTLALEATALPFTEPLADDAPHAVLVGAGHVGRALLHVLSPLPWRLTVIDPREDWLPAAPSGSGLAAVHAKDPPAWVTTGPTGAFWVVATHSHDLDLDVVDAVLRRGDFCWLGLIGSLTKRRTFERRLLARGHASSVLARLICPMGLPSIQDKHPAAIAIAVAAELLSLAKPEGPSA